MLENRTNPGFHQPSEESSSGLAQLELSLQAQDNSQQPVKDATQLLLENRADEIRDDLAKLGITEQDVEQAIEWARKRL